VTFLNQGVLYLHEGALVRSLDSSKRWLLPHFHVSYGTNRLVVLDVIVINNKGTFTYARPPIEPAEARHPLAY